MILEQACNLRPAGDRLRLPVLSWSQVQFSPPLLQRPERAWICSWGLTPAISEAHASARAMLPLHGASRRSTESGAQGPTGRTGVRFPHYMGHKRKGMDGMKTPKSKTCQQSNHAVKRQDHPRRLSARTIRHLVNAALASHGGLGRMTLNDWREMEEELKRRIDHGTKP